MLILLYPVFGMFGFLPKKLLLSAKRVDRLEMPQQNRPRRANVKGGKRFMPSGMLDPHDLGQAGNVRSQIVRLRLKKHDCQSQQN
jgi:hypothetical protein